MEKVGDGTYKVKVQDKIKLEMTSNKSVMYFPSLGSTDNTLWRNAYIELL